MKTLVTGGSSLLGRYLAQTKPAGIDLESTWYTNHVPSVNYHLDICNKSQLAYVFERVNPDLVIHCAAMGSVDYAERNYKEVAEVNVTGTENVLWAAREHKAKVVYISTNAVYEGNNPPYSQSSQQNPVNAYGRIKRMAERAVIDSGVKWLIIRPFLLYGWPCPGGRTNWGKMIVETLEIGKPLKLVNDIVWQPTYAYDVARFIWQVADREGESFNVASSERLILYDFGVKIAEVFKLDAGLIEPVPSNYFGSIAKRPKDTTYDLSKLSEFGLELPSLLDGLTRFKLEPMSEKKATAKDCHQ